MTSGYGGGISGYRGGTSVTVSSSRSFEVAMVPRVCRHASSPDKTRHCALLQVRELSIRNRRNDSQGQSKALERHLLKNSTKTALKNSLLKWQSNTKLCAHRDLETLENGADEERVKKTNKQEHHKKTRCNITGDEHSQVSKPTNRTVRRSRRDASSALLREPPTVGLDDARASRETRPRRSGQNNANCCV